MPFRIASFLFTIGAIKQMSIDGGFENLRNNGLDSIKMGYCFWPFVMIGLYTVVPKKFGTMYYDSFNLLWMIMISYMANRAYSNRNL